MNNEDSSPMNKALGLLVLGSSQGACHPQTEPDVISRSTPAKLLFVMVLKFGKIGV